MCIYLSIFRGRSFSTKSPKIYVRERHSLMENVDIFKQRNGTGSLTLPIYGNQLKTDLESKCKPKYEITEGHIKKNI
jgi:hypothetical protein